MPKKQQKNAFFFYMQDKMQEFQRAGYTVHSIGDCVPLAHPRWKAEPEEVKKKYEAKAKAYKQKIRCVESECRLDNTGKPISEYRNPDEVLDQNRNKARVNISRALPSGDEILEEKFYFIHFEYLLHYEDEDEFYPAEVALVEYSIFSGIHRTFHKFIKPAEIPKGWKFDAKARSEQRHKLPYDRGEQFDGWDDNYYGMWNQMCDFVNPQGLKPNDPPLYCLMDEYKNNATTKCLDWVYQHARSMVRGMPSNRLEKVHALEDLVLCLFDKSRSDRLAIKPSEASVHDELRVTKWDFEPNTCCPYHEEKECRFCALGFVRRWCYAISDFLKSVEAFRFDLTENHVPSPPVSTWIPPVLPKAKSAGTSATAAYPERPPSKFDDRFRDASPRDENERRSIFDGDDVNGSSGSSSGFESGGLVPASEQPRLLQQSMGRGSAPPVGFGAGLGRGSSSMSSMPPGRGRGRGNFVPGVASIPNSWSQQANYSKAGGEPEGRYQEEFPSLGSGVPAWGGGGGEGGNVELEEGWPVAGGRRAGGRCVGGGRGRGDGDMPKVENNLWSSMGRGRGSLDVLDGGPSSVGRGRGFHQTTASASFSHAPPPGFGPTDAPRGKRGVQSLTVRRPPPGFTTDEGGASGGVDDMSRRLKAVQMHEEDWG